MGGAGKEGGGFSERRRVREWRERVVSQLNFSVQRITVIMGMKRSNHETTAMRHPPGGRTELQPLVLGDFEAFKLTI